MSIYHSVKTNKDTLDKFKKDVLDWFNKHFDISNLTIKAYNCYGGDVRIYLGNHNEIPNRKSSFRRTKTIKDENGNITGYEGTRGHHSTVYAEYIAINIDEFEDMKKAFNNPKDDSYDFFEDYIFRKLKRRSNE